MLLRKGHVEADYEEKDPCATKETLFYKLSALRVPGEYCIYPLEDDGTKGVIIRVVELITKEKGKIQKELPQISMGRSETFPRRSRL